MHLSLKCLLGAAAVVATGTTALLGTGAGTAGAADRAHCDRAERAVWTDDPSRNVTGHHCTIPTGKRYWYTVEIDTLVQPHHTTDYLNGTVDRTETTHNRTIRCLGYTSDHDTVNWFGCVPD
ncbi:hypothetical protein GCM10010260_10240 [Streptomyces filipinensis]|uniref:Uncharacterized protein n=1 Tax=Streptomyces filipinensis TaxID=66887 RepID=A0A918I6F7_9ACTN|nr:hypothetical protein [Streptomyces filipinensis]GGU80025.1 hypothetical protein GCM10010260_10240 [Streptomyces filipinensis]